MTLSNAQLHWDDDGLPRSTAYDDVYFSRDDAEGESRHVFIAANRLDQRWQQLPATGRFTIAELGFGSGLNFMQSVQLWRQRSASRQRLHYIACEKHPLSLADIQRMHALWPTCADISDELLGQYPDHSSGCHRLHFGHNITLDLHYGDAAEVLSQGLTFAHCQIDCWFLDGFSPALNPALWHEQLLRRMAVLSSATATLSTYSVAGAVRQNLRAAGFSPQKLPGFGRKREMLFAHLQQPAPQTDGSRETEPAWSMLPAATPAREHAIVIGAGLAGCSTAWALARRGWRVTVLDSGDAPAAGASGVAQLALRCRLFKQASPIADFYKLGFVYASRQFACLQRQVDINWHASGVLQLASAMNKRKPLTAAVIKQHYGKRICLPLDKTAASALAGVDLLEPGWHLPLGGWLSGTQLCAAYLAGAGITFLPQQHAIALKYQTDNTWQVETDAPDITPHSAAIIVIANAAGATKLPPGDYLPLHQVRGQTSQIASSTDSRQLQIVINGARTVFPATQAMTPDQTRTVHTLAASYSVENNPANSPASTAIDDQTNLDIARKIFANPELLSPDIHASQAAFRCSSSDRIPVVGQLANHHSTLRQLAKLARNANYRFQSGELDNTSLYYPGLYVNLAHGSNGLATCPLSGELLASMICNEALPCSSQAIAALSPIRFLISQLKQQRHNAPA